MGAGGAYGSSPNQRIILPPHENPIKPHQPQLTPLCAGLMLQDQGQAGSPWDLIPEGTALANPTPSGHPRSEITLVWGGGWPGAKGENRVIQTHTMAAVHTLSISRTQRPTPFQGTLAAEVLRTVKAEAHLPAVPSLTLKALPLLRNYWFYLRLWNSPFLLSLSGCCLPPPRAPVTSKCCPSPYLSS